MTTHRRLDIALGIYALSVGALFLGQMVWSESSFYREIATIEVLLYVGGLSKLFALASGGAIAWRVANLMKKGTASRFAWRAIACWLLLWAAGQASLGVYQWVLHQSTPFPSVADPFFVVGYVSLVIGFAVLIRAYAGSGLALGSPHEHFGVGGMVLGVVVVVGYVVLLPIVHAGGAPLELALNLAYPGFDLVALVPAVVLLRITLRLRGGAVFWVWSLVLGGFLAMAVGDVLYAYLTMLEVSTVDPVIDVAFLWGYGFVARGVLSQYRVSS